MCTSKHSQCLDCGRHRLPFAGDTCEGARRSVMLWSHLAALLPTAQSVGERSRPTPAQLSTNGTGQPGLGHTVNRQSSHRDHGPRLRTGTTDRDHGPGGAGPRTGRTATVSGTYAGTEGGYPAAVPAIMTQQGMNTPTTCTHQQHPPPAPTDDTRGLHPPP